MTESAKQKAISIIAAVVMGLSSIFAAMVYIDNYFSKKREVDYLYYSLRAEMLGYTINLYTNAIDIEERLPDTSEVKVKFLRRRISTMEQERAAFLARASQ